MKTVHENANYTVLADVEKNTYLVVNQATGITEAEVRRLPEAILLSEELDLSVKYKLWEKIRKDMEMMIEAQLSAEDGDQRIPGVLSGGILPTLN